MSESVRLSAITAAVLAGGRGTRLQPAVADRPKVLAPVLGRPFVAHLLDFLAASGLRRVVLLTGYLGGQVRQVLGGHHGRMTLAYSEEPAPRGTGGALREALPVLDSETILLLNGDSYFRTDLAALAAFHRRRRADASLALARVRDADRYGKVEVAPGGRVTAFAEKDAAGKPGWVNGGVYLIERALIERIPPGRPASLERELLPGWIRGGAVFGRRCRGPFLDIGTPESYAVAPRFVARLKRAGAALTLTTGSP
jgi:D-glycero-alpha-D-manno-heptose 1-phosphate guanylyltransferase